MDHQRASSRVEVFQCFVCDKKPDGSSIFLERSNRAPKVRKVRVRSILAVVVSTVDEHMGNSDAIVSEV